MSGSANAHQLESQSEAPVRCPDPFARCVVACTSPLLMDECAFLCIAGAIGTFMISDCAECTKDKNSAFCSEAKSDSNFVSNSTTRITIRQKKQWLGASAGASYCWTGKYCYPLLAFDGAARCVQCKARIRL